MLALDVIVQTTQHVTVSYELNNLSALQRPAELKALPSVFAPVDLFFIINEYLDGFAAVVLYDEGKYDATGLEDCVEGWMGLADVNA